MDAFSSTAVAKRATGSVLDAATAATMTDHRTRDEQVCARANTVPHHDPVKQAAMGQRADAAVCHAISEPCTEPFRGWRLAAENPEDEFPDDQWWAGDLGRYSDRRGGVYWRLPRPHDDPDAAKRAANRGRVHAEAGRRAPRPARRLTQGRWTDLPAERRRGAYTEWRLQRLVAEERISNRVQHKDRTPLVDGEYDNFYCCAVQTDDEPEQRKKRWKRWPRRLKNVTNIASDHNYVPILLDPVVYYHGFPLKGVKGGYLFKTSIEGTLEDKERVAEGARQKRFDPGRDNEAVSVQDQCKARSVMDALAATSGSPGWCWQADNPADQWDDDLVGRARKRHAIEQALTIGRMRTRYRALDRLLNDISRDGDSDFAALLVDWVRKRQPGYLQHCLVKTTAIHRRGRKPQLRRLHAAAARHAGAVYSPSGSIERREERALADLLLLTSGWEWGRGVGGLSSYAVAYAVGHEPVGRRSGCTAVLRDHAARARHRAEHGRTLVVRRWRGKGGREHLLRAR